MNLEVRHQMLESLLNLYISKSRDIGSETKYKNLSELHKDILLILNQSFSYLQISYELIKQQQLQASQILLRSSIEYMVYSMYFYEFPDEFKIFLKSPEKYANSIKNKYKFEEGWIASLIDKIELDGKKFNIFENKEERSWRIFLYEGIAKEASKFVHLDMEYLRTLTFDSKAKGFVFGYKEIDNNIFSNALSRIFELTLFEVVILTQLFDQIDVSEFDVKEINNGRVELNRWKAEHKQTI